MSRNQRVSVKGRGAEIFFPQAASSDDDVSTPAEAPVVLGENASKQASVEYPRPLCESAETPVAGREDALGSELDLSTEDVHAYVQASEPVSLLASTQTYTVANVDDRDVPVVLEEGVVPKAASDLLAELWGELAKPATITNAFRFTDGELARLTDVVYELSKRHSTKLSKQDVMRLALGSLLHEYEREGDASLLGRFVLRKRQWRRGGG